jgi:antibiotic biosynthesis monooxygenase (ABM) superfamily enzyme
MKQIDTLEQWAALAAKLAEHGYRLWQMQYGVDQPEGFHAWFFRPGKPQDFEVVTHNNDVYNAIINFKAK